MDAKAEQYLTRRIERLKLEKDPEVRSIMKSTFMLECAIFAEADYMSHDERFGWVERMLREVP